MSCRVLILRAPGTNCDEETAFAFGLAGAVAERVHIDRLLECPDHLREYQVLCVPGGFSYGDDVAAGRILANQMRGRLAEAVHAFRDAGKLVLGICNGFQVLIQTGVLLPDDAGSAQATLTGNDSGRFEDRWVQLQVAGDRCALLAGLNRIYLPVAHAEGRFVARDEATLNRLDAAGQLVLRYASDTVGEGRAVPYPENPNGSQRDVAGICDSTGRVLGLMPHPERNVDHTHHPRWTRGAPKVGDGLRVFQNAVAFFK